MEFQTSTVPFSVGGFMGSDETMASIFAGASEALVKFYAERGRLYGSVGKIYCPRRSSSKVTKGLVPTADGIYRLVVQWRKLIASAKGEVETASNALGNRKLPSDPIAVDDMRRIRDHFQGMSKDAQLGWLKACLDASDKDSLNAVLFMPRSLNLLTDSLREVVEKAIAGPAYDALAEYSMAIDSAEQCLDRVVSCVRSESGTQSDFRAAISSDSQG
jgi:hypothetical protein